MERFTRILHRHRARVTPQFQQMIDVAERYLASGDPAALKTLTMVNGNWIIAEAASALGRPNALDDFDRRLIALLLGCDHKKHLFFWLRDLRHTLPDHEIFPPLVVELQTMEIAPEKIDSLAFQCASMALDEKGEVLAVGKFLLEMDDERLTQQLKDVSPAYVIGTPDPHRVLLRLFVNHAPARAEKVLEAVRQKFGEELLCTVLLEMFGDRFESMGASYFRSSPDAFDLGEKLVELNPQRYGPELAARVPKYLSDHGVWSVNWILPHLGELAVEPFVKLLTAENQDRIDKVNGKVIVQNLAKHGGAKTRDALLEVMNHSPQPAIRAAALEQLIVLNDPTLQATLEDAIEKGMAGEARDAVRFAVLAAQFAGGRLRERLWQELAGKSKLRRDAAAEALAAGDSDALDRAAGMLADKSREARWGAVLLLGRLKSAEAIDCLLNWMPREDAEEIRDEIARALRQAGVGVERIVRCLGPVDLDKLMQQAAKIERLPGNWLHESDLPPLPGLDGQPLPAPLVRYLLHRQSRQKEPIIDPEAAPLYAMIDRRTSGDFAFKLLSAFIEAGGGKPETWAMIIAGMLGDNRTITTLASKVRGWAQDFSQRQGEWGIEALAINGSDAAISAVESIASKFKDNSRRKFKVIGEAAQNALELAAKRMGLSMEDLGDRVVPTMGFEAGRARQIPAGKRTIEAAIGLDFKLAMKDADTGKRAVSIPKTAAPEVVAEFKGLGKLLLEVAKSQAARLERLMVCQHRWTAGRWRERFLQHPMLFPFAVRLVWGTFDDKGTLLQSFRALPDRSLTDPADESIELPAEDAPVGIVHPLEMTAGQLSAWRTNLSDYEIEAPFPQIDRPIARVAAVQRELKKYQELNGTQINSLSFAAKSERSGWMRGAVGGGGTVASYRKRFQQAAIDAFITFDGVPLYMDPAAITTIGTLLFLPIDTASRDFDDRLMRLGDVPPMVYSEAISDMTRICGQTGPAESETKTGDAS